MKRRIWLPVLFGIAGTAVLVALGVWQVQRLTWKEGLIAELEQRLSADPVALPQRPDPERDAYLRVRIEGRQGPGELHVLTSLRPHGPGFRVIAPFELTDGRRVLVDLGFVPEAEKDPETRGTGPVRAVTGALFWPDETDSFTPDPDRGRNIWFARDAALMAEALSESLDGDAAGEIAPVMVVAEAVERGGRGRWPEPQKLGARLANDHLEYAITWFSLALVWAVMSVLLVRREMRRA